MRANRLLLAVTIGFIVGGLSMAIIEQVLRVVDQPWTLYTLVMGLPAAFVLFLHRRQL